MVLETVDSEGRDTHKAKPDLVRWSVQVILLALVSPALVAVLLISGVCISVQKVVTIGERIFAATPSRLHAAAANPKV